MKGEGAGIGRRGLLIASVVFILIVGAIFFAITGGMFGGRDEEVNEVSVTDVYDGRSVRMTVEGPIVANEDRESYQITVGFDSRTVTTYKGYDRTVASSGSYSNNRQAYTEFVHALARARFAEERNVSEEAADQRGACATGRVYTFEMLDDGRTLSSLWTSSCSEARGTLAPEARDLKELFDRQIPNLRAVLGDINLR